MYRLLKRTTSAKSWSLEIVEFNGLLVQHESGGFVFFSVFTCSKEIVQKQLANQKRLACQFPGLWEVSILGFLIWRV